MSCSMLHIIYLLSAFIYFFSYPIGKDYDSDHISTDIFLKASSKHLAQLTGFVTSLGSFCLGPSMRKPLGRTGIASRPGEIGIG